MNLILERQRLKEAVDDKSLRKIGELIAIHESIDFGEAGGEIYLRGDSEHLRFRYLPSTTRRFIPFLDELSQGRYVERNFEKLLKYGVKNFSCATFSDEWKELIGTMEGFRDNGRKPKEANEISDAYRSRLRDSYHMPNVRRLNVAGEYAGCFHIHDNWSNQSPADEELSEKRPELIIIYNRFDTKPRNPNRNVRLLYLYNEGTRSTPILRTYRLEPYNVEAVSKQVRASA